MIVNSAQLTCCLLLQLALAAHAEFALAAQDEQPKLDRSGKTKTGKASYYGPKFYGKKMANGKPMKPQGNNAVSKTLPLGTTARVTNVETGKSDVVVITDRGPYVDGRIIDVSPQTAKDLDFKQDGVAKVKVKPLQVPKPENPSDTTSPAAAK